MIHSLEVHIKKKFRTIKSLRFPILLGNAVAAVHKMPRQHNRNSGSRATWDSVLFHTPSQCCFQGFVCLTSSGILQEVLFPWGRGEVLEGLCFSAWFEGLTRPFCVSAMFGMKREEGICSEDTDGELCCLLAPLLTTVSCCASVKIIHWKWRLSPPRVVRVWRVWQSLKSNIIQSGKHIFIPLFIQFASPLLFFKVKKRSNLLF